MKKIFIIMIITAIALSSSVSCAGKKLTEKEFSVIWQEYLQKEFEESFDEKQSVLQREKILSGLLSGYGFSTEEFKLFMKENHIDKYNKIFVE
jgi:hypothetical protein